MNSEAWLDQVRWTNDGLVPAIAQDARSGRLMMMAWMNREALAATAAERRAIYWSRSRQRLWRKGEQSGHEQKVKEIRLDCDHDAVLLLIEQVGGIACHTGRESCFFQRLDDKKWIAVDPIIRQPEEIYNDVRWINDLNFPQRASNIGHGSDEASDLPLKSLFKSVLARCIVHHTKRVCVASKSIGGCARREYRY